MSFVIEEENFLYTQQRANTLNTQTTFRPNQRITPTRSNNFKRDFNNSSYNSQPNFNNDYRTPFNYSQNQFREPRMQKPFEQSNNYSYQNHFGQPQNLNYSNNSQQYRTNRFPQQNFGQRPTYPSTNTQRSRNTNQHFNQYRQNSFRNFKPEPMDTSSGYTHLKQNNTQPHNHLFTQHVQEEDLFENPLDNEYNSDGQFNDDYHEQLDYNVSHNESFKSAQDKNEQENFRVTSQQNVQP